MSPLRPWSMTIHNFMLLALYHLPCLRPIHFSGHTHTLMDRCMDRCHHPNKAMLHLLHSPFVKYQEILVSVLAAGTNTPKNLIPQTTCAYGTKNGVNIPHLIQVFLRADMQMYTTISIPTVFGFVVGGLPRHVSRFHLRLWQYLVLVTKSNFIHFFTLVLICTDICCILS